MTAGVDDFWFTQVHLAFLLSQVVATGLVDRGFL